MTFTRSLSTNNYGPAKFIVDGTTVANGTHSTIQAAIDAASSGDTIAIRPGTYTENLTLKAGVNLTGWSTDGLVSVNSQTPTILIVGKATYSGVGNVNISNVTLKTNSDFALVVSGSSASTIIFRNCFIYASNNTAISFTSSSSSAQIAFNECVGDTGTTGISFFSHSSAGSLVIARSSFSNSGSSTTASTISAGFLYIRYSYFLIPITTSGTAYIGAEYCYMDRAGLNTTMLTVGGSNGNSILDFCIVASGTASAISISSTLTLNNSIISSSNTNAVTGAGTLTYQNVSFTSTSQKINTTTQTGGIIKGGQTQDPSTGYIGETVRHYASSVSLTTATTTNVASISLTAGVWNIDAIGQFNYTGSSTNNQWGVNTVSATLPATAPDAGGTFTFSGSSLVVPCVVPGYRLTLTATTTVYFVMRPTFSTGSATGFARISATRVG